MSWLSVFVFACAANIDTLIVGFSCGLKCVRIPLLSNVLIALLTGMGTFASMTAGVCIETLLPASLCRVIGGLMLVGIGLWTIWQGARARDGAPTQQCIMQNPQQADKDHSGRIEWKETFLLAGALVLNNIGMGIGASILGLPVWPTSLCTMALSFVFVGAGLRLGRVLSGRTKLAFVFSGLLVIALGVYGMVS